MDIRLSGIARVDGQWVDMERAAIPIHDRGFLLGDGVYDTCRLFERRWFRFEEHAARLHASADILALDAPAIHELRRLADGLVERNPEVVHGTLRMTLTRGSGGRGLLAGAGEPRLVMTLQPLPSDWEAKARRGWTCMTARVRHPPPTVVPPALKGQGRVFSLLAALEAERAGCDQALLLSTDGHVTEGATWNVFWRRGDILRTPAEATGLLAGVTRGLVMELAPLAGLSVETGAWERAELDAAEEVFATMTSLGMVPVLSLDGRALEAPGRAVERITPLYWERVREEAHV